MKTAAGNGPPALALLSPRGKDVADIRRGGLIS